MKGGFLPNINFSETVSNFFNNSKKHKRTGSFNATEKLRAAMTTQVIRKATEESVVDEAE